MPPYSDEGSILLPLPEYCRFLRDKFSGSSGIHFLSPGRSAPALPGSVSHIPIVFSDPELPRSIYVIEGARKCAIEFCSLSKTAGFTGTRCGYTVVPKELVFTASDGREMSLNAMWNRRQSTKYNGTSYIVQNAAAAIFSEEGIKECQENLNYYKKNAKVIADTLTELQIPFYGGIHSPYIWFECPNGMDSWTCFDYLLENIQVVGTPGAGFGENGKNYFRLTSFGTYESTVEAMNRFKKLFAK